jgi:hypothetical protein
MVDGAILKTDDGRYNYIQGDVVVEVDEKSILRTIDALDRCNAATWIAFAVNNDLPADPFNKKLLKPPLMGILQNAWYVKFNPDGIPEKCIVNQKARCRQYMLDLEKVRSGVGAEAEALRDRPKGSHKAMSYVLSEDARKIWQSFGGQKKLMVDAFVKMKAISPSTNGATAKVLTDSIKHLLETKQPPERVVAFYINDWKTKKLIIEVGKA